MSVSEELRFEGGMFRAQKTTSMNSQRNLEACIVTSIILTST